MTSASSAGLHDPISWELFDDNVHPTMELWRGGQLVWTVETATDDQTLTVPQPPSTLDAGELGSTPLEGRLVVTHDDPATDYIDKRTGPAEPVYLSP